MKLALTIWNQRIAPVFDVAGQVQLVEIENGNIKETETRTLASISIQERLATLHAWGVQVLICGAMSVAAQALARHYDMELHAFVAGAGQEVLQAWLDHRLNGKHFTMPGCRHRGQRHGCRFRQRCGHAERRYQRELK